MANGKWQMANGKWQTNKEQRERKKQSWKLRAFHGVVKRRVVNRKVATHFVLYIQQLPWLGQNFCGPKNYYVHGDIILRLDCDFRSAHHIRKVQYQYSRA
jgi:hypothetical protein